MKRIVKVADQESGFDVMQNAAAPPIAESQPQDLRVVYTHTRSIKIGPEVLRRNRVIAGLDDSAIKSAYKILRTQVLQRMKANGWSTLAVTSPSAGEGKSLTAVNLAISIAKEVNHTVLLVDLDLRRPSIARYFGYEPDLGLRDYLLDDIPLSDILFTPGIDRLAVLPGGKPLADSSELLSAPKMVRLAQELKGRYPGRIVVYDMPPLLIADDVLAFAPHVDASLLVVQNGRTRKDELSNAVDLLDGFNVLGTVLNRSVDTVAGGY